MLTIYFFRLLLEGKHKCFQKEFPDIFWEYKLPSLNYNTMWEGLSEIYIYKVTLECKRGQLILLKGSEEASQRKFQHLSWIFVSKIWNSSGLIIGALPEQEIPTEDVT